MRKTDGTTLLPGEAVGSDWLGTWREPQSASRELNLEVRLNGRVIQVRLSRAAQHAAAQLTVPLIVEMELYFSCLVRKVVRFRTAASETHASDNESVPIVDNLILQFRPVTTQHCSLPAGATAPPLETMPVARPQAFVPHWVEIDFRRGEWSGEFGY